MSLHSSSFCSSKLPYLILHLRKIKSEISACDVPPNAGQAATEVGIQKNKACTIRKKSKSDGQKSTIALADMQKKTLSQKHKIKSNASS